MFALFGTNAYIHRPATSEARDGGASSPAGSSEWVVLVSLSDIERPSVRWA